jgi:Na+/phosphate symporter
LDRIAIFKTINVLSLALLICYLFFSAQWLLWLACLLVLGNTIESRITARITALIAEYWMKFAHYLGSINSKVLLTVIFFLVLTPVAFFYRLFNKDNVAHFIMNGRKSYFDDINKQYKKSDFEKVW